MQHLILIRDEVVQMMNERPEEFIEYMKRSIYDISHESVVLDAYGVPEGMIYVDGPSDRDGIEIVYLWKDETIKPMFEMSREEIAHLRDIIDLRLARFDIGQRELFEADLTKLAERCPDCQVLIGQPHLISCTIEICTECGMERIGCSCKGHDRWEARWKGSYVPSPFSIRPPIDIPFSNGALYRGRLF
jgi:ferredoxin-like protein FixX